MVARRQSTQRWWAEERGSYALVTSVFVLGELKRGRFPGQDDAIRMMQGITLLEIVPEITSIANVYVRRKLMPAGDLGDAFHVAAASFYGIRFLLTWNCAHLANANKERHLQVVNAELGLRACELIELCCEKTSILSQKRGCFPGFAD